LGCIHPNDDIFFASAAAAHAFSIRFLDTLSRYVAEPKPQVGQNHGFAAFVNFTMPTHSRPNARED